MRLSPLILLLLLGGCSWQSHLTRYMSANGKLRTPAEAQERVYRHSHDGQAVTVKEYRDEENRLYRRNISWPNGLVTDTIYYQNGEYHSYSEQNIYAPRGYSFSKYFDRRGRPLYQAMLIFYKDSIGDYRQFFTREGELLPEKHPIHYSVW